LGLHFSPKAWQVHFEVWVFSRPHWRYARSLEARWLLVLLHLHLLALHKLAWLSTAKSGFWLDWFRGLMYISVWHTRSSFWVGSGVHNSNGWLSLLTEKSRPTIDCGSSALSQVIQRIALQSKSVFGHISAALCQSCCWPRHFCLSLSHRACRSDIVI
jgi:hypothetical protein